MGSSSRRAQRSGHGWARFDEIMTFTIIGFACGLLALWGAAYRPSILLPACVFFISFSGTSVVNVNAITFSLIPSIFFLFAYLLNCIISGRWLGSILVSKDHIIILGGIILFCVAVLVSNFVSVLDHRFSFFQFTQSVFLLMSLFALGLFSIALADDDTRRDCVLAALAGGIFAAAWGCLQAVLFYVGIPYPDFVFNNSVSDFAYLFDQTAGDVVRIASVAVEPSWLTFSLLHPIAYFSYLFLADRRNRNFLTFSFLFLAILVVCASTSTTGYAGLAILYILLLVSRPVPMLIFGMFFSAVVATILVFFPVVAEVINEFTFEKTESYSFNERTGGMLDALILFSERPFLGWGWGRSTSHSVVTIMLANVGLIGSLLFIGLVVCSLWGAYACSRSRLSTREVSDQIDAARLTVIISLTASVISGLKYVVLDTWFWWGLLIALESAARRKQSPGRREAVDSA
jgi:hypothetical protein